jgi:hypothetical protein
MCDSVQENSDGGKNNTDKKNSSSGKQSAGDSRDQMKNYLNSLGLTRSQQKYMMSDDAS